ncbi:MAG: class SAM-dependent methyltransferase [Sphingomonadales bacterium]|nr:class SAM-dependent methyltransferase [Sphingomonadales bacterium]
MDRSIYDAMAGQDSIHWWYVARRDVLRAMITRYIPLPNDARILEIGCGTGHNLSMLAEFGTVEGSELDAASRAIAIERFGSVIGDARLPELEGVEEGGYDMVALLDVLEHVEDDIAALKGIMKCLKPGGKILVTVPQYQWLWSSHDVANHHFKRYSKKSLSDAAAACGLEMQKLSSFNSLLFPLAAVNRIAAKIRRREGSEDALPPAPVNSLFRTIFGLERHLIGRIPLPPGVSLAAILSPR